MSERTSQSRRGSRIRATAVLGVGTLLAGGGIAGLAPGGATASSHREAPAIAGQPQYDNTDLYAWVDPNSPGKVSLVANWIPFEEPGGGPNFYPWATDARYDVNIDNDDDGATSVGVLGRGGQLEMVMDDVSGADSVGLTVEPASGSEQPTGELVLQLPLDS